MTWAWPTSVRPESHQFYVLLDNDIIGFGEKEEDRTGTSNIVTQVLFDGRGNNGAASRTLDFSRCLTHERATGRLPCSDKAIGRRDSTLIDIDDRRH
jgi:hypothetical protein